ncbi:MAG TPA: FdtA/QdtA family cupin domain-containing protein [Propylenella sp.]
MSGAPSSLGVGGARLIPLPEYRDLRGTLVVGEFANQVPFAPVRFFVVHGVPPGVSRGYHAAVNCDQLLVAVAGSVHIGIDDGIEEHSCLLDSRRTALCLPRNTFCWQHDFSPDAVLLVLASEIYELTEYVSDRAEYRRRKIKAETP